MLKSTRARWCGGGQVAAPVCARVHRRASAWGRITRHRHDVGWM